jgi:hypothetical protein
MKRPISRVLVLAVAVLLLCAFDKGWKLFSHKTANLSVMMPETPKEESSVEKTVAGDITLWQASVIQESKAYFVSYSDMPKSTWKGDPKKMLEGARDGAAQRVKGKVVADREIKLAGKYPGREFKVVVDKMELTQRVYLVKHRLYQVNMGCLVGACTAEEIQEYLNSLKLLK